MRAKQWNWKWLAAPTLSLDKQNGRQILNKEWNSLPTFQENYLITKQSAKLNNNYYTSKSEVYNYYTQKPWGQKHKLELESELKYADATVTKENFKILQYYEIKCEEGPNKTSQEPATSVWSRMRYCRIGTVR